MMDKLNTILESIANDYKKHILSDSRYYLDVSIAEKAADMGFHDLNDQYKHLFAIVPIKGPVKGMKVRIDGRTFINYAQVETGVVVPNRVARQAGLSYKPYVAQDSMIYNYA